MAKLAINGGPKFFEESSVTGDLRWHAQYPVVEGDCEIAAVVEVLKSRQLSISGRSGVIAELEDALSAYYGVPYALTFNCGTAALHSAYMAAGAGPGTEVITSPYTWVTNVTAILAAGAIPVFADIHPASFNIHAESIAQVISPWTRAISVTHLYGHPADMQPIMELARSRNLVVIEDASQAHGASYRGAKVGTLGDMGCFSLQAGKQMVAGEGGFLTTTIQEFYERAMLFGHHPARLQQCLTIPEYRSFATAGLGFKYRIPPVCAALAKVQLGRLDCWNEARARNAVCLNRFLQGVPGIRPPCVAPDVAHTFYMFPMTYVSAELGGLSRERFLQAVRAEGVPALKNYCDPIHLDPLFRERRYPDRRSPWEDPAVPRQVVYAEGDCPVAEQRARDELLLYFPRFTEYCPLLMEGLAGGIRKVAENVAELL
jgi:dTDP-4-amino-4,6-dideoxygalactose transaminase